MLRNQNVRELLYIGKFNRRFGGIRVYRLHLHGLRVSQARNQYEAGRQNIKQACSETLKTEATCYSETSIDVQRNIRLNLILMSWGGVKLSPLGTPVPIGHIIPAPGGRWTWSTSWNENRQQKQKSAILSTTSPKRSELGSNPGRYSGKPTLTAWAMARLTTRRYIPKDWILLNHRCENLTEILPFSYFLSSFRNEHFGCLYMGSDEMRSNTEIWARKLELNYEEDLNSTAFGRIT
jgi:hypothetical protein